MVRVSVTASQGGGSHWVVGWGWGGGAWVRGGMRGDWGGGSGGPDSLCYRH